ncbi:MAG: hypothetical protein M3Q79_00060 [bacterium]|nr:hypothetical protein [bacterium]
MTLEYSQEFTARLCPHRGAGQDNTLESIKSGIDLNPLFVEFDTQYFKNKLHLGHPPDLNTKSTLTDALELFTNTTTVPKVDIKLGNSNYSAALELLITELTAYSPKKVLVNIAGGLNADKYMESETSMIRKTSSNVLLNIDLGRYSGKTAQEIATHVNGLDRKPFSVSPNLDDDIQATISFAIKQNIPHVHFWSHPARTYRLNDLYNIMQSVLDSGLEVYFDIKTQNIIN